MGIMQPTDIRNRLGKGWDPPRERVGPEDRTSAGPLLHRRYGNRFIVSPRRQCEILDDITTAVLSHTREGVAS
jgi:hypothetical protein